MNTKIYVGNLSYNTTEDDLRNTFENHGTVLETNIITDRDTGRPRGFAFVTMKLGEEAQAAITALDGTNLDGRTIAASEARSRDDRSRDFSHSR